MKLVKQLAAILGIIVFFAAFDISAYNLITKRYINSTSPEMQAKSIELSEYLPFDENSRIAKIDSTFSITEDLPVVDGAAALYPVFSGFVNAVYPEDSVCFDGENFTPDSALQYTNTRGAYKSVVDGTADIVFCVSPSEEQMQYAADNGAELEFVPIGCEAFVFIVNKDNPVDNLTVGQLKGLFSGKYTSWAEVGGDNMLVDVVQRNPGSGSQSALLNFMDGEKVKKNPLGFMGRSIGFSFRFYVEGIVENGAVKMLALDGVYPSKENVSNRSYPIVNEIYAVYRKDNDNPNIQPFIDWILSEEGQAIVEESGYSGVN